MGVLDGKVVVVTGAGRGIGREIALLSAAEGAAVLVNDCGDPAAENPADAVIDEIASAGGQAIANRADIGDPEQAATVIEDAVRKFGRVDAVVNNAGIVRDRIFQKMSLDEWSSVINVHLNGYFYVSRAAAGHFKDQGSGSFVHFTSTSGLVGNFGQANYTAAKLGVVGLSNAIALDMQRAGVRSNCIAPFAWSRMVAGIPINNEADRVRVERAKTMTAAKIAPLVVFLCADASADVTGQVFAVRKNEIFLMSRPEILRSVHRSEGWTPQTVAEHLYPALKPSLLPLRRSSDVFCWDAI